MSLGPGTRLGPYEIVSALGAGGMGEVYRARDTRLQRDVAIKVLPAGLSSDPERVQRFEQEARAAAALNHPNILAVFDIGEYASSPYIVSEVLEGETLRERVANGALPARKAIEYAIQVARGLAAAHEKGIVHRDLKPDNVFVTTDGRVKILDFGLAKLTEREPADPFVSALPTTPPLTLAGMVLGTIGYMAPEQVRGLAADTRTDIFAFGALLYEMLSGRRAFVGDTTIDVMTAILKEDPPDLPAVERPMPPALQRIVDRCLEKSPAARFQTATDLAFALEGLSANSGTTPAVAIDAARPAPVLWGRRAAMLWASASFALLLATVVLAIGYVSRAPAATVEMRLEVTTPPTSDPAMVALSPDGRHLAFVAAQSGQTQLWVRDLSSTLARPITGTEGALYPFWAPDSRSIGFFSTGKLQRIGLTGGPVQTLANAPSPSGASWNRDGTIIFSPVTGAPIMRISDRGGTPITVAGVNRASGGTYRAPHFLPDGRHFLYFVAAVGASGGLYVGSIDGSEPRRVADATSSAVYVPPGLLMFLRQQTLVAMPFDAGRAQPMGDAVPIAQDVPNEQGVPGVSAADSGTFAFRTVTVTTHQLKWFDRGGTEVGVVGGLPEGGVIENPELSADNRRVAFDALGTVWLLDATRGVPTRLTLGPSADNWPLWTPDSRRIIFRSSRKAGYDLYQRLSNGAGGDELLLEDRVTKSPEDVSPDGRFLLFRRLEVTSRDLWALPLQGGGKPFPVVNTQFEEREGQFSPDGRWITYVSNASGRFEVYVQPFPGSGGKWQVSTAGGFQPRWRGDGKALFYLALDGAITEVPIALEADGQNVTAGKPTPLFMPRIAGGSVPGIQRQQYAVTRDGQRFLINTEEPGSVAPITVVLNWQGPQK